MFDVPEVELPMVQKIHPKVSIPTKNLTKIDKKTVQIHTLTSKLHNTKIVGKSLTLYKITLV